MRRYTYLRLALWACPVDGVGPSCGIRPVYPPKNSRHFQSPAPRRAVILLIDIKSICRKEIGSHPFLLNQGFYDAKKMATEKKQKLKELLALAKENRVKLPTDKAALAQALGTQLEASRTPEGELDLDVALENLKERFGVEEDSPKKKRKASEDKDEPENDVKEEPKTKKERKKEPIKVVCPENEKLVQELSELTSYEYKGGVLFKANSYKKAVKTLSEYDQPITSGAKLAAGKSKLPGIGKGIASMIDEFLEKGTVDKLEEYRKNFV